MKLKYKKIILIISMSTIAIGLITFSISRQNVKSSSNVEEVVNIDNTQLNQEESSLDNIANTDSDKKASKENNVDVNSLLKADENNRLQKDANKEVNELVQNYLSALVKCDIDALSKYVTDKNSIDLDTINKQSEYIEDYKNIECYTIKGVEDGSYVVYVYEELKILGIDTLAPGMIRLYVTTSEDGNLYIHSGKNTEEVDNFINSTSKNEEVVELIQSVNLKLEEAKSNDADLKNFIDKINEITEKAETAISQSQKSN